MGSIGGGKQATVEVVHNKKRLEVKAQIGLFRLAIGIVQAPEEFAGMIIVPSHSPTRTQAGRQLVTSIYHAYRQTEHILANYGIAMTGGTKGAMVRAAEMAHKIHSMLMEAESGVSAAELTSHMNTTIIELAQMFEARKALTNQAISDKVRGLSTGTDSRNRVNPGALAARTTAMHELMRRRLEDEILRIDPRIKQRQQALINLIKLAELRLAAASAFVERLLIWDALKPVFDTRKRNAMIAECEFYAGQLETITFRPFRTMAQLTAADLRTVASRMRYGALDTAWFRQVGSILKNCRRVFELKKVQVEIERGIVKIMHAQIDERKNCPVSAIRQELDRALKLIEELARMELRDTTFIQARAPIKKAIEMSIGGYLPLDRLEPYRNLLKEASAAL